MSSPEGGLPDDHDPMAVASDDEIMTEPEIFATNSENDSEMMSDNDLQSFALPGLGDDLPTTVGIPDEDPFAISIPVHDHLIIDHPDDEHDVAPILAPVPLVAIPLEDLPFDDLIDIDVDLLVDGPFDDAHGDEGLDENTVTILLFKIPVVEISSDTSLHPVSDSFESVTSSALQTVGLQRHSDEETAMSAAPIPPYDLELDFISVDQPVDVPADPEPILAPEHLPDHDLFLLTYLTSHPTYLL
ncbi:hypothetical protein HanPI659440_Chr16g0636431 [Helianthus annuus]|nr:hypothetical protein HanPI659440_Chr16g0636431 [Helianthus annuus]